MRAAGSKSARELRSELEGQLGPNGRPLCTWCRGEVPKGRRTWCSADCVHAYRLRNDWTYISAAVFKRDRGICSICLIDTREQQRQLKLFRRRGKDAVQKLAEKWGIPAKRVRGKLWDVDHIVPCVEGGDNSLSNLQTLCIRCHAERTRRLNEHRRMLASTIRGRRESP